MQSPKITCCMFQRLQSLPLHLLLTILPYLDQETRIRIQQNSHKKSDGQTQSCTGTRFLHLISMSIFLEKYISKTDRSIYLNFYSESTFAIYQQQLLGEISCKQPEKYYRLQKKLNKIYSTLSQAIQEMQFKDQLLEFIKQFFEDPLLPMPKMRKQGIAIYTNSVMQSALADEHFRKDQDEEELYMDDFVLELQEFVSENMENMQQIIAKNIKNNNSKIVQTLKQLYYHPQILTAYNFQNYLIKDLPIFNIFICLHSLLSVTAEIYYNYIADQCREFQKFVQFQMRYCIYRASVISLQQSQLSKLVYESVEDLINYGMSLTGGVRINGLQDSVIMEASLDLENKRSGEQAKQPVSPTLEISKLNKGVSVSESSLSPAQQLPCSSVQCVQMSSRMFVTASKIWINHNRKIKHISHPEELSPSKFVQPVSLQSNCTKTFIRILNKLSHANILKNLQKEIEENCKFQREGKCGSKPNLVRDQDIANIFGQQNLYGNISENQNQQQISDEYFPSFNSLVRSLSKDTSNLTNALMAIQNHIKLQPYRYEKCRYPQKHENSNYEHSHENYHHLQKQLQRVPSFRQNKLLSKASMISKFTKMSQFRIIGNFEQIIESDNCILQQILMQYHSYLMDASVNEKNVHWLGHTQMEMMGDVYSKFQEYVVKFNEGFICYLLKLVEEICAKLENHCNFKNNCSKDTDKKQILFNKISKMLLNWHLTYMDTGFIPKMTTNKILQSSNKWMTKTCERNNIQNEGSENIQLVCLNFQESDKMIQHYNQIMWKIQRNVDKDKLKIYEERKYGKNSNSLNRINFNQKQKQKVGEKKRCQRKRRNSEQFIGVQQSQSQ